MEKTQITNKGKLALFFESGLFKKSVTVIGFIFIILTAFLIFDPEPMIRYGYPGVFVFNLFGPGTYLIPTLARHLNVYLLAAVTSLGMAFNDSVSWYVGKNGQSLLPKGKRVKKIEDSIHRFGPLSLFFWSLIPFPYDLIGLISGYLGISYPNFFIPTFLGKFVRFVLLGMGTIALYGKVT